MNSGANSKRGTSMASGGMGGHNGGISSAVSTGGISGNELPINGLFNMGGAGVGSNQGLSANG